MRKQPTAEQSARAQERREHFRKLVKQVATMSEEQKAHLTNRLGAVLTCEGHALSLHNTLLLLMQCPTVSIAGGFHQWLKAGRAVKKGEHGYMIWFPRARGKETSEISEPKDNAEKSQMKFLIGTVFDIAQTQEIESAHPVAIVSPQIAAAFGMTDLPNVRIVEQS